MKLERCVKGHFYDGDKIKNCPYCEIKQNENNVSEVEMDISTIAYIPIKIEPVVGWLVCIQGAEKGRDYRLVDKRNFIGSSGDMDICINGDSKIDKENNFIITYNDKQRIFVISPGQTGNIIYLNKKPVYETIKLENYSLIEIGDTKLVFIEFCGEHFVWKI